MNSENFHKAHKSVVNLVKTFADNHGKYMAQDYNESAARKDFIDKFFIALGWDVNHDMQTNPNEQEVKIETRVTVALRQKRADYAFFLYPNFAQERFFVEAKRPSASLNNPDSVFQTIRYAFSSAKAALSILTNFDEFHIIDCRFRPDIATAINHVHKKYHFTDFYDVTKFGEFFYLFGREAVEDGALERYAETLPKPKGKVVQRRLFGDNYQEIDDAFLVLLESYREDLAKMFKRKNPELDSDSLTEAVQRTIDRLIFIRFLEDKLIEPVTVLDKFGERPHAWKHFISLSREFDKTYNGIIFKHHPVIDREDFVVDDKVFVQITDSLADKYSPYHFNYIPIHILGSIYERFLGSVIVAKNKTATVEQKPEVRKAGGVFYTPQYIVKYIVENTIGELIKDKKPANVAKMRFADIACGSGSFLLGVYEYILAWHTRYYNDPLNSAEAMKSGCVVNDDRSFALSFEQKKNILVNNIFGVDIDRQAYEVTQLSLFLKLLEDETQGTKQQSLLGHAGALLPSLDKNIICGNALVEDDIGGDGLFNALDEETEKKLNPMRFEVKFPEIMRAGGFDAIVGNPPYRMLQPNNTEQSLLNYFRNKFLVAEFKIELFHMFLQRGVTKIRTDGRLGFIVPTTALNNVYAESLRGWLLENSRIISISVARGRIFAEADVHTSVLIFEKSLATDEHEILTTTNLNTSFVESPVYESRSRQNLFSELSGKVWNVLINSENESLITRLINDFPCLDHAAKINRGLITGDRKKYFSADRPTERHVPILTGSDVHRYAVKEPTEFVLFERPDTAGGSWDPDMHFASHKIVVRQIGEKPTAGLITEPIAVTGNVFTVRADSLEQEKYVLGVINSKLAEYFWRIMFTDFKDSFPQVTIFSLAQLPIFEVDHTNIDEKAAHDVIVRSVEQIMEAKPKLAAAGSERDREFWQNKCDSFERTIDDAVYALYKLTPEEIRLVEGEK